jgi:hypothetical protein
LLNRIREQSAFARVTRILALIIVDAEPDGCREYADVNGPYHTKSGAKRNQKLE